MFLKEKLTSRKFWCFIINMIFDIIAFFTVDCVWVKIIALVTAACGTIIFILGESLVDSSTIESTVIHKIEKEQVHNDSE